MGLFGELAAVGTALAYAVGSVLFTFAGRSVGTGLLNRVRLILALVLTTLQGLTPIFLIPIGYFLFKERITRRIVLGKLISIAESVLLFL